MVRKYKYCNRTDHPDYKYWDLEKNTRLRPEKWEHSTLFKTRMVQQAQQGQQVPEIIETRTDIAIETKSKKTRNPDTKKPRSHITKKPIPPQKKNKKADNQEIKQP